MKPGEHGSVEVIAHGAKLDEHEFRAACQALGECEGLDLDSIVFRQTHAGGDAVSFARDAASRGVARLVAAGGDGTIHEIVQGLISIDAAVRPVVGIIALGTANDLARGAGIPTKLDAALRLALSGPGRQVDLVHFGGQPVVNVASGGVLSEATAKLGDGVKAALGDFAYALGALLGLPSMSPVSLRLEGADFGWEGEAYAVAVANARTAGGGFELCPAACIDDGALDVCVISTALELVAGMRMLEQRGVAEIEGVYQFRGSWLELEVEGGLHLNFDGERTKIESGRFTVEPGALRMALPSGSPLLSGSALVNGVE
jgi:lipid kinase YegS